SYTERALDAVREAARGSDLIGVSSMAFSSKKAQQAMAALRPLGAPIVWGGVHASTAPEHCTPHHDLLCVGEGEGPLLDLLSAVDDKRSFAAIPNLWVREGDAWRKNPVRPQEADLDKLPPPDFELEHHLLLEGDRLVPFARRHFYYGAHNCSSEHCLDFGEYALLQTSRGCPFKCSFCSYSALHDLYKGEAPIRMQSVEKSIADLLYVRKRLPFVRFLWFTDDTFFVREAAELREWCAAYRRHVGLPFAVYTDPITFREDKLQWLIDAGLYHVTVGIQSGSARSGQQVYDRLIQPGEIGHLARVVNKYVGRMHAPLYQVIGLSPFEDEADLLATIHVILSLPPPFQLDCFGLKFFPGTPLYERAAASGWMDETDEQAYNSPYSDYSRMLEHRLGRIARPDLHRLLHALGGAHTRLFAGSMPRLLAGHVESD
ncbi:MAG: radical SAM protein, partial [Candidatus Methylomirabilis sp.]|nr:radical SAM protein [Deltaproteobacteria bacterium]